MNNQIEAHFKENYQNAKAKPEVTFQGEKYRITLLTERLVRLEYSQTGTFFDDLTEQVINRNFEIPKFTVRQDDKFIEITTSYFRLHYQKEKTFDGLNIEIVLLKENGEAAPNPWNPKSREVRNFQTSGYGILNLEKPDFQNNFINRYETCVQISNIFNIMLNYIKGVEAKVIERDLNFRGHINRGIKHVANEVIIDGEKYLLDLTLDLYLIQSGFQTQHFGYETNANNDYEIIPLPDCKKMDESLGILNPAGYKDEKEEEIIQLLLKKDYSGMSGKEILDYKLQYFSELLPQFNGHHEGKQLINKLIREILNTRYKEFNMKYENGNNEQIITCFVIANSGEETWILYSNTSGIVKTSREKIDMMLANGWKTKSNTLNTLFEEEKTKH